MKTRMRMTLWQVEQAFPGETLIAIEQAIKASENAHVGEIRFAVEGALDGPPLFKGQSARERAIGVFSQLRVLDTEHNNGVLIYPLLADRDVEIVADRGIDAKVGAQEWDAFPTATAGRKAPGRIIRPSSRTLYGFGKQRQEITLHAFQDRPT
ncbi:MAG: TPM domain-containing protein [Porticoccaceae bacterium]